MDSGLQEALRAFLASEDCAFHNDDVGQCHPTGPAALLTGSSTGELISRLRSDEFSTLREYVLLPSAKTPRWIVPLGNVGCTSSGLDMYMPYAPGAQTAKQLLLAVARTGWSGWARHRVVIASRKPLPIESLVSEITGERHPAFALSLGTPGRFRKATVRVMNHEGRVVGYIKLPMTAEAVARVRHETTALDYLATFSSLRAHIPRVLFAGKWGKRYILFQSPGPSRAVPAEFAPVQQMFLQNLRGVDGVHRQGNSLVEEVGARWQKTEEGFDSRWRALGRTVLMTASRELGNLHIRCGITHGDFAPWNSRISEDGLFVFDWESAERQTPYLWDVFHFEVQVASLLHGTKHPHRVFDRDSGERALYLLYLLKSACQAFDETQVANHPAIVYRFRALTEELCA